MIRLSTPRHFPVAMMLLAAVITGCAAAEWDEIEPGLAVARFPACTTSTHGDSIITVVRADPSFFEPVLLAASDTESKRSRSVEEWAAKHGLVVATNAGMFHEDHLKHVGYMVDHDHVNNPVPVKSYKSVLALDRRSEELPPFQLADLENTTLEALKHDYHTLVQNLRMISHDRKNVWSQSEKRWSTAALGVDRSGNLLFIFCRSPYSVHDLNDCLLKLPIEISRAQYLEGGPEASLFISSGETELLLVGSFETGFNPGDGNSLAWPVPNVIGLVRTGTDRPEVVDR